MRARFFFSASGILLLSWVSACRKGETVMARVGSLEITQNEFRRKLSEVAQSYQNYVITPNGRRQFLDILIREKMILAAASDSEVARSPEFKAQVERLKKEEEERLREGREYLLTRLWLDDLKKRGTLKPTEEEARDYHRKHDREVHIRHILVASPEEAEELANRVRRGASFAQMAKTKSLDGATAVDGGKMQAAIYGEIIPELEDIVFRMRLGEISGPIKSKFGYHILKKESERRLSYNEAEERIIRLLEKQKLDRYLQSIQPKYPVEVVDAQFK
ncbi:MAG: peptidylprolyl isomerase [Elusimicrobia bacterium]|nr:peptidylprolyl isomerase [Elusimicrobiota bacterium]